MSFNGKGLTIEGLFRSLFTELTPGFLRVQLKTFSKFGGWTFNFFVLLLNCIIVYFIYL